MQNSVYTATRDSFSKKPLHSILFAILMERQPGGFFKFFSQMALRAESQIIGYLNIRIPGIDKHIFHQLDFFLKNILPDCDSFLFLKKTGKIIGIDIKRFRNLRRGNSPVQMCKNIVFALTDALICDKSLFPSRLFLSFFLNKKRIMVFRLSA